MEKERKFITHIAMKCTKQQWDDDLEFAVQELGYGVTDYQETDFLFPFFVTKIMGGNRLVKNIIGTDEVSVRYAIEDYNAELFLALAAMSEGEEFWPGEWVKIYNTRTEQIEIVPIFKMKNGGQTAVIGSEDGFKFGTSYLKKATKEELIHHLAKKQEPQLQTFPSSSDPIHRNHDSPSPGQKVIFIRQVGSYDVKEAGEFVGMDGKLFVYKYTGSFFTAHSWHPFPKIKVSMRKLLEKYAEFESCEVEQLEVTEE